LKYSVSINFKLCRINSDMLMDENAQRNFANNPPPTDVQME